MEDLKKESKRYTKAFTQRNTFCVIENGEFQLNKYRRTEDETTVYRCKYYNNTTVKCQAFAELDDDFNLVSYNSSHTCPIDSKKIEAKMILTDIK